MTDIWSIGKNQKMIQMGKGKNHRNPNWRKLPKYQSKVTVIDSDGSKTEMSAEKYKKKIRNKA